MGIISDFLLVDPSEIPTRFPDWVQPGPGWMPPGGDSEANLEGLDVVALSGLTSVSLNTLLSALVPDTKVETEFVSPSAEQILTLIPGRATDAMRGLDSPGFGRWADAFIEAERAEAKTIGSDFSREARLAASTRENWDPALESIVGLARRCQAPRVLAMFNSI